MTNSEYGAPRRAYRSELRERQAAETRGRIVTAAAEVFAERGYAATTLAEIGRRAGVSKESVAAAGPKRDLLIAAFESAISGREGRDPMSTRPDARRLFETAPVGELLELLAELAVAANARAIGLWRALSAGAAEDAELSTMYDALSARRLVDNRLAIDALDARGLIPPARDRQELACTLALISGFDPYQLLVREFGWSEEALLRWWVDSVTRLILTP